MGEISGKMKGHGMIHFYLRRKFSWLGNGKGKIFEAGVDLAHLKKQQKNYDGLSIVKRERSGVLSVELRRAQFCRALQIMGTSAVKKWQTSRRICIEE